MDRRQRKEELTKKGCPHGQPRYFCDLYASSFSLRLSLSSDIFFFSSSERRAFRFFIITKPILFISALTKQRILKVLETAKEVYENRSKRVPTAKLNEVMLPIIENYPPPAWKGKYIKIKYITQLPAGSVPSFVFFCNLPQWIKDPYKRFLENKIRENWDFTGTPINIFIREK